MQNPIETLFEGARGLVHDWVRFEDKQGLLDTSYLMFIGNTLSGFASIDQR
jgi:hypothetical protein